MPYLVGPKGQIVIAKEIRDRLGVGPGWRALQRLVDDHLEISFVPPEHGESLKGSLAPHLGARVAPEAWEHARTSAWKKVAQERAANSVVAVG